MDNIIIKTPLEYNDRLSSKYNCNVYLKREDLQKVRSFKIRGAYNKIIKSNKDKGFVTASAGNHAQGVGYVCNKLNLESNIFIPENTPLQKISRIQYFGNNKCKIYKIGNTFDACLKEALQFCKENNKIFIHPFDDQDVIAGQGNIALEVLENMNPDIMICCVGGGGLISGTINALKEIKCDIYGAEPFGAASMYESMKANKLITLDTIDTFVDGASVKTPGKLTYDICKNNVKDIFKIKNGEICTEMIDLYQNEGIIVEPAGALALGALDKIDKDYIKNKNVVCILSGGNNDLMRYPEIVEYSLRFKQLKYYFIIEFKQTPGELKKYIEKILVENTDITRFEYIKKNNKSSGSVLLGIEVANKHQINIIKQNMIENDFKFLELNENNLLYNYLI